MGSAPRRVLDRGLVRGHRPEGRVEAAPRRGGDGIMTHALRFQVFVLPNSPWDELLERFKYVEDLGFDLVATADHFVDWKNPSVPWLEAWTLLAAVARET